MLGVHLAVVAGDRVAAGVAAAHTEARVRKLDLCCRGLLPQPQRPAWPSLHRHARTKGLGGWAWQAKPLYAAERRTKQYVLHTQLLSHAFSNLHIGKQCHFAAAAGSRWLHRNYRTRYSMEEYTSVARRDCLCLTLSPRPRYFPLDCIHPRPCVVSLCELQRGVCKQRVQVGSEFQ